MLGIASGKLQARRGEEKSGIARLGNHPDALVIYLGCEGIDRRQSD
jgi:hypothetical protein